MRRVRWNLVLFLLISRVPCEGGIENGLPLQLLVLPSDDVQEDVRVIATEALHARDRTKRVHIQQPRLVSTVRPINTRAKTGGFPAALRSVLCGYFAP